MNDCANLITMTEWVRQEQKDGGCRPCALAVLAGSYASVLARHGLQDESIEKALSDEQDPVLRVAEALDGIKGRVPPDVQESLLGLDCEAQLAARQRAEGGETNGV